MWQTVVILLVLLGVAIYLVRRFVRIYRAEAPACAGCSGCCGIAAPEKPPADSREFPPANDGCREPSFRGGNHR